MNNEIDTEIEKTIYFISRGFMILEICSPWNIYVFSLTMIIPLALQIWPIVTYLVTISRTLSKVLCLEKEPRDFR